MPCGRPWLATGRTMKFVAHGRAGLTSLSGLVTRIAMPILGASGPTARSHRLDHAMIARQSPIRTSSYDDVAIPFAQPRGSSVRRRARCARGRDDKTMLRAAAELTRDLNVPNARDLLDRPDRLGGHRLWRVGDGDAGSPLAAGNHGGRGRDPRAVPRGQLHPRTYPYQAGRAARVQAAVERR